MGRMQRHYELFIKACERGQGIFKNRTVVEESFVFTIEQISRRCQQLKYIF